jgi:2-methylisocitrate lyase-like PEP mutase family enzyme
MVAAEQIKKAEDFLSLHHHQKLLVLPNIWDPLGARLLEALNYPAVATASAAVAFSLGYNDGQKISFTAMLEVIQRIAHSVQVPLTADIEGGFATTPEAVAENVREVIRAGAVGINFEDGTFEGDEPLHQMDFQCERIRAIRTVAESEGLPLVINARIDVFLRQLPGSDATRIAEAVARAKAYLEAGADCIYPITMGDVEVLKQISSEIKAPINVYASASAASMRELETIGISRLSLGPNYILASLATMKKVAQHLQDYGAYDLFTENMISFDEIGQYISRDGMSVR